MITSLLEPNLIADTARCSSTSQILMRAMHHRQCSMARLLSLDVSASCHMAANLDILESEAICTDICSVDSSRTVWFRLSHFKEQGQYSTL